MELNKKDYKRLLLLSLEADINDWTFTSYDSLMGTWVEYSSKEYTSKDPKGRVSFQVDNLNFGTCAFVDGYYVFKLRVFPFSKLSRRIHKMKKHIKNKTKYEYNNRLNNTIKSIIEGEEIKI